MNALVAALVSNKRCGAKLKVADDTQSHTISTHYKSALDAARSKGVANLAITLFRPFTPFLFALLHAVLRAKKRGWWRVLRFANASAFVANLAVLFYDPVIWASLGLRHWYFPDSNAKAGIFLSSKSHPSGLMARIMNRCHLEYNCASALCTGDLATIYPTATYTHNPATLQLQRVYLPSKSNIEGQEQEYFGLDISCRRATGASTIVCFVAGIGGGPTSPYIVEPAAHFLAKGWGVVILIPRGMLDSRVRRVENLFDPAELNDVHTMFTALATCFPTSSVLAVGSSLGGMSMCNYLGRMADSVPQNLKAVLALSGTFRSGYTEWWRYQGVFQPVIVPDLLEDFLSKYEDELERPLSIA